MKSQAIKLVNRVFFAEIIRLPDQIFKPVHLWPGYPHAQYEPLLGAS